ncbi:class I SAM-dependent methyltransferase [Undibacterium sp. Jales W-56]|uniref:class I SAM-dependent methyltransferase n=1 Tax=Undibacterium sp. Jales W-56 TaxID=2897325 RepID=UPI0021D2FB58|nr:class I SAM-dependent methyltransferase [Undibacterium sp. Jales W-56]MCU6435202.1 class I SAM-dependent methyltransferase [Undibacterium sp. Jales W-56]
MTKLFSPACERNSAPILDVLKPLLQQSKNLLEIGSGTGQHAVYFGAQMPHLLWQCSDRVEYHSSILAWQAEAGLDNVQPPYTLDVATSKWPGQTFDAVFTANTCHIMAWQEVEMMFAGVSELLTPEGLFCIYGPFNYAGRFTSESNQQFDASLRSQAAHMGIRDIEKIESLANQSGLHLRDDHTMPANNRLLVFVFDDK